MGVALIYDERTNLHKADFNHPENPGRIDAVYKFLKTSAFLDELKIYSPPEITDELILSVHTEQHLKNVKTKVESGGGKLDEDTYVNQDSMQPARLAAGSAVHAVDLVLNKKHNAAFSLMRPPGHHAESYRAMGFCLFNNVAIGAAYALSNYNLQRTAIVDFDVHHGNGTQEIFYNSSEVLFISLHQHPLYPGTGVKNETGEGRGEGFTINFPLPPNTNGETYISIFKDEIIPQLEKYKPELLFISAGFDAHKDDPLAQMNLSDADYRELTLLLKDFADRNNIGIVSLLEGGYNYEALSRSISAHLKVLNS